MTELEALLDRLETITSETRLSLDNMDLEISRAEELREALSEEEVRNSVEAITVSIELAVRTAVTSVVERSEALIADFNSMILEIETVSEDVEAVLSEAKEKVDASAASLGELTESMLDQLANFHSGAERSLEGIGNSLVETVAGLTETLDHSLRDAGANVVHSLESFTADLERVTDAPVKFVGRVEDSLAGVVNVLENIEKIVDPIQPALSLLEELA